MVSEKASLNAPVWKSLAGNSTAVKKVDPASSAPQFPAFQETWYLNLTHPQENRALTLKFSVLMSTNGFRRIAEVSAVYFNKASNREPIKVMLRQRHEIEAFSFSEEEGLKIGECEFNENHTSGKIESKGHSISWNLTLGPRFGSPGYELMPPSLRKAGLVKNSVLTTHADLSFSGTCVLDGETFQWDRCPGMQGHQSGPRHARSWTWGHCNSFVDEQGIPTTFLFEGISANTGWMGWLPSPKVTALNFRYQGKSYFFNSLRDFLRLRSEHSLNEWRFQADHGELSFRGVLKAQYKDFAGITLEDTNGSLIYSATTRIAELQLHVYRGSKLEATFNSSGGAGFEIASREKNPYVPELI